ncbi:hypothetical protein CMT75_09005 [Elizabethkingia anophelis]|uniref:Uncharacterized protein n=1 Tax=Elizabethkingia anophelis TaxID=1117645 RepID=A0AAE4T7B4_9FLAO|nr:hypothetical protein [Elizabethkingia anophelis]MDV3948657.1 hypothetical protein [Elizabethkingia anophelis]
MRKIKSKIQSWILQLIRWALSSELAKIESQIKTNAIQEKRINHLLDNLDISVDVHYRANSWAVISIQGEKTDFIKFIDLGRSDILEIQKFLRYFDRTKIDAAPQESAFLRIPRFKQNTFW